MVSIRSVVISLASASAVRAQNSSCPTGYVSGNNAQTLDIIATPADVWALIGDFGNLSWAGVAQTNLSAGSVDNVPGAIRTSIQLGFFIDETLLSYSQFATSNMSASEVHKVEPFSVAPIINTTVSAYADALGVAPLCNGLGSRLTFNVSYCTLDGYDAAVDALFTTAHYGQLLAAQEMLGALNYTASACSGTTDAAASGNPTSNATSTPATSGNSTTSTTGTSSNSTHASAVSSSTRSHASASATAASSGTTNTTTTLPTTSANAGSSLTAHVFEALIFVMTVMMF